MNRQIITRVLLAIFALLVVLLIVVQVVNGCSNKMTTETAVAATVANTIEVENCAVIRKEGYVENKNGGVLSYEVSNGSKVAKGGVIAYVYESTEAASNESKRIALKQELEQMESLKQSAKQLSANPDSISKNIYQKLYDVKLDINKGSSYVENDKKDLVANINQWNMIVGNQVDFDARINQLKAEISSIDNTSKKGTIVSNYAGFFLTDVDGYENAYDFNKVTSLSVSDLEKQVEKKEIPSTVIGKVCEGFIWYIGCVVDTNQAENFIVGDKISVVLPYLSSNEMAAEVVAVNKEKDSDKCAVILKCNNMDTSIATAKDTVVNVNLDKHEGIKLSQSAIHFKEVTAEIDDGNGNKTTVTKNVPGAYKVRGSTLQFVQVVPIYSTDSYVICDPQPDSNELLTDNTIQLYDTVAIGGDDLYDGKPII